MLSEDIRAAKRVYLCGNGGSAANAIHIANDLVSCGVKAHSLTADVSTLTAIANDYGYEYVFSRQLFVFGEPGDLLIALSGSGNSQNIVNALLQAEQIGMNSWAIVGNAKSEAAKIAKNIMVTERDMQTSEEAQLVLGHTIMKWLKNDDRAGHC